MDYTKGDWKKDGLKVSQTGAGIIAICPTPQDGGVFQCVANAHLIASAPLLYEALKLTFLDLCVNGRITESTEQVIKQALARAEGKGG